MGRSGSGTGVVVGGKPQKCSSCLRDHQKEIAKARPVEKGEKERHECKCIGDLCICGSVFLVAVVCIHAYYFLGRGASRPCGKKKKNFTQPLKRISNAY